MATLRDVARRAGVSAMTVSNVVNGREGRVSAATRERVRAAIDELGYVPNAQARALAGASSRIVGLVYGVDHGATPLAVSHESLFVGACERACHEAGRALMLCAAPADDVDALLRRLRAWNVAGVIALGTVSEVVRRALPELAVPVVLVDSELDDDEGEWDGQAAAGPGTVRVGIDDAGGGALAGERLRRCGHRRVVFAGPDPHGSVVDRARLEGLREGLGPGGEVTELRTPTDYAAGVRLGQDLASRLGPGGPTAVFASADVLAMGVVAGLRRAGVSVPESVSVVGFDGFEVSTYCDPVLTTVVQPVRGKASSAVAALLGRCEEGAEVVLPVSWREGGTLAPAPEPAPEPAARER